MFDAHDDVITMETELDLQLGKRLRELRISRGMTQDALARFAEISFQQIQKYERGANRISVSRLLTLSRGLDVNVTLFFDAPGSPTTRKGSRK